MSFTPTEWLALDTNEYIFALRPAKSILRAALYFLNTRSSCGFIFRAKSGENCTVI